MSALRLALATGDPHGVGPEVLVAALRELERQQALPGVSFTAYGPQAALQALGLPAQVQVVDVAPGFTPQPGQPSRAAGAVALASLRAAVAAVQQGQAHALVTQPIDKATVHGPDFPFAGHTEYLAQAFGGQALMLMVHGPLRVALVTTHVPLRAVADALSAPAIAARVAQLGQSLRRDFGLAQPRIALLGLNPHAGDGGLLGHEERDVIAPALELARAQGWLAQGPFAADGFFQFGTHHEFDGVLAMYHDQGLVPFKALAGGRGVNFTAGLSAVRTSPDHGTAYALAGTGRAHAASTIDAIVLAAQVARQRARLTM